MALTPGQRRARRMWRARAIAWEDGMNGVSDAYAVGSNSPPVVADFVNEYYRVGGSETTFASMFTFGRTGTATYFDSNGILQTAATGVTRLGNHVYNGTSWVNKGILIETEARTNQLIRSQDFSNAAWFAVGGTASMNATGLDGASNSAATFTSGAGSPGAVALLEDVTVSTSTAYTCSVWFKAGTQTIAYISAENFTTPANGSVWFNLSSGTVGTQNTGLTGRITNYANGFYRCSITFTTDAADTSGRIVVGMADADGSISSTRSGTETLLMYGAQFEAGSTPSSYIPTAGSAVTRNADSLVIAAANMSASTSAMSLQLDGTITYADEGAAAQQTFLRWQTDASNYISLDLDTDGAATGEVNANQAVGGTVDTVVAGAEYTAGVNVAFNIASRHTSGAINVAKDGTAATADTTPASLVDLSARNCELFQDAMGNIGQFRQWAVDLGDTGIATASS